MMLKMNTQDKHAQTAIPRKLPLFNEHAMQEHLYQRRLRDVKPQVQLRDALRKNAKQLYFNLKTPVISDEYKLHSKRFLDAKLKAVSSNISELPNDINDILKWIENNNDQVGKEYRQYLNQRQMGAPRRYFTTKSHALNFLQSAAPTKLVDGCWLYGFARYWNDPRYAALTKIYLEELGEGQPDKNHVVLYKKLLRDSDCNAWENLSEDYFTQGAIQLALGINTDEYLPEVIGFNLGYEQLPLHLLITAYELRELDIGPYYFTLHVTVDNVSTGHARRSLEALFDGLPLLADKEQFYQRVRNGYELTQLGLSTNQIISAFDLEKEFTSILREKSLTGKNMHSDRCLIEGQTINEWLSNPAQIPQFIDCLVSTGWIKRHQDPQNSQFWRLIEGDAAKMFGVFSAYEKQVIYDWIAGDCLNIDILTKKLDQSSSTNSTQNYDHIFPVAPASNNGYGYADSSTFFDMDICHLEQKLSSLESKEAVMDMLISLMSPSIHHTPVGLMATRIYSSMIGKSNHAAMHPICAIFTAES